MDFTEPEMAENEERDERPESFWNRVYAAVVITTFVVVMTLWAFSRYFA